MPKIRTSVQRSIWIQIEMDEAEAERFIKYNSGTAGVEYSKETSDLLRNMITAMKQELYPATEAALSPRVG